jgi:fatty acid desaturase
MDTFATVDKATIIDSRGVSYIDFRNRLAPKYGKVWLDIFTGYAALCAVLFLAVYFQKSHSHWFFLAIPAGGILIGYIVSALHLFIHEASHYHLAADRKQNDLLSNIFLGSLVGMDVQFYRTVHFAHHRLLGTVHDTEKSYFDAITWSYVIELLTGIRVMKVIAHRNKNIKLNDGLGTGSEIIKKNNKMFFVAAILNLALVMAFFISGFWQAALAWMIGLGVAFPFLATFRQILEHRSAGASAAIDYNKVNHGVVHRMFGDGPIASTLGPAGFNRHLLHHWDPQVSYTRLKEVEDFLKDTPLGKEQQASQTTYFKTFISLLKTQ